MDRMTCDACGEIPAVIYDANYGGLIAKCITIGCGQQWRCS